ncbi:MAG: hypothetical protein AAF411_30550, partial [Myxococcota bacterium]
MGSTAPSPTPESAEGLHETQVHAETFDTESLDAEPPLEASDAQVDDALDEIFGDFADEDEVPVAKGATETGERSIAEPAADALEAALASAETESAAAESGEAEDASMHREAESIAEVPVHGSVSASEPAEPARVLEGSERIHALWRAGWLASRRLGDFARARRAFDAALQDAGEQAPAVLRDYYEEARFHGDSTVARSVLERLRVHELEDDERSALFADAIQLALADQDDEALLKSLGLALDDAATHLWSLEAARLFAAEKADYGLLRRAHVLLASEADAPDASAAHFAAAARAAQLADEGEHAEAHAREALERDPASRYAVALLEEILRAQGKSDEVVALLRNAADAQAGEGAASLSLMLAGAAAAAAGDKALASETYEQAADQAPSSVSPLWALLRLGVDNGDDELVLRALEALAELETREGDAGAVTLRLGEHYAFVTKKPELAEGPLEACLESEAVAPEAALALALLPESAIDPALRIRALRRLAAVAPADRALLLRDAAISAFTGGTDPEAASELAQQLRADTEDDRFALLHDLLGSETDRAEGWLSLAAAGGDAERPAMMLQGLLSMLAAHGSEGAEDAFLLAQELLGEDNEAVAAVAADETLEASDDPDPRTDALLGRIEFTSVETVRGLLAGAGRAATTAKREEAVPTLRRSLESSPDDLASWEALRVAARDRSDWDAVAEACDRLSAALPSDGESAEFHAELVEEGAAVRMDY